MTGSAFEDGDMERRVQFLEKGFETIDGKLDRLLDTLVAFRRETDLRFGDLEKRMEARFGSLESRMEARFGGVEARLERIDATLEHKATAADVAEVRGMVRSLPTIVHMITLVFGILAGAFAVLRYGLPHP